MLMTNAVASRSSLAARFAAAFPGSRSLFERARGVFPDGVTHELRRLEPFPVYVDRALGVYKWDVDGHRLIDFWSGHGAILLGHSHPAVVAAVQQQAAKATHPGACHELEIEWGDLVRKLVPSAERVRFTASGTEATLMALRLARLFTGRPRVLKFAGHFHGWHDAVTPGSDHPHFSPVPGVTDSVLTDTIVVPPNDPEAVERVLSEDRTIGSIILEPTGGHWGQVPIRGPFLRSLRELTSRHGCLLIFDEVITGFRVAPGGAQAHYAVTPDLTTLAKILAGGLPGGCLAGRADVLAGLEQRSGHPRMRHPGTFNANPLSAAAGIATLRIVGDGVPCRQANAMASHLRQRLNTLFAERSLPWLAYGEFSGFRLLPGYDGPRPSGADFIPYGGAIDKLDTPRPSHLTQSFRQAMLLNGVDLPGLAGMTTCAHTEADIDTTVEAVARTVELLREESAI
jgi:glutamate-1-semialdehyde 2,1-aminomutase